MKYRKPGKAAARRKWQGVLALFLFVVVLLMGFLYLYVTGKLNRLSRTDYVDYTKDFNETELFADNAAIEQALAEIDIMESGGTIAPLEGEVVPAPAGVYNILLIGTDERGETFERSRADAIMLLSLNTKTNTLKLMSFERALGVSVPGHGDDWLTHAFAYGGPELLLQTVRDYFKIDVTRYVRVNFHVFETAITDIGGVEVELTENEAAYMNGIAGEEKWQAGPARFDGPTALVYSRIRHLDSDWNRVERQRKVIQGAINQALRLSPAKIDLLANKLLPMVQTNLTNAEILRMLVEVPTFAGKQAAQVTAPIAGTYWGQTLENGRVVMVCDLQTNIDAIENFLYGDGTTVAELLEENQ